MDILGMFLNAKKGELISQLTESFQVNQDQAGDVVSNLVTSLTQKAQSKMSADALPALLQNFSQMDITDVLEAPEKLDSPSVMSQGASVLNMLLGDAGEQGEIISDAASKTGVESGIVEKILSALAAAAAGFFQKSFAGGAGLEALMGGGGSDGLSSLLSGALDQDGDGATEVSDIANLAKKLF